MNFNPFKKFKKRKGGQKTVSRTQLVIANAADKNTDERIKKLEATAGNLRSPFDRDEHLDKSRSKIAFTFVRWYFALILTMIIGIPLYNKWVGNAQNLELDKLLNQLGTLLGTPLGFVVGYYFKESKK